MEFKLSKEHRALQEKAREFTEQVLFPYEMECEENNGISPETRCWSASSWVCPPARSGTLFLSPPSP